MSMSYFTSVSEFVSFVCTEKMVLSISYDILNLCDIFLMSYMLREIALLTFLENLRSKL